MAEPDHSITVWIDRLRRSDPEAARALWGRFFDRMVAVARRRLAAQPARAGDEEDAALSAFADFARAARDGRFPDLSDRAGLWALLVTFTLRKARAHAARERRLRRGGGRAVAGLEEEPAGKELSPDEEAMLRDHLAWLLGALPDAGLRQAALARMQGYSNDEIAERLGCARSTVERRLLLIREKWGWLIEQEEEKSADR